MSSPGSTAHGTPVIRRREVPGLSLSVVNQDRARALPGHGHERAYLSFLVTGSYNERFGSAEIDQVAPAVVFHPPALEHVDAYGPRGGRFLIVKFERGWLDAWTRVCPSHLGPREVVGENVLRDAWALYLDMLSDDPPPELELEARVAELIACLRPARRPESARPRWLERVVERLRAEYAAPPSMTSLARESGVDPAHLSRTFRRHLGCTPTAFVQRQRVRHVWRHLVVGNGPDLSELAREAGFSDQSHCTRIFHRQVGAPPGAFRNRWAR